MTEAKFDARLKEAMAEIRAVLDRYDVGAYVNLVSPSHAEYLYRPNPAWTCIAMQQDGQVRVRLKTKDFKTPDQAREVAENSAWCILALRDGAVMAARNFQSVADMLRQHWDIEHQPFYQHTRHREN